MTPGCQAMKLDGQWYWQDDLDGQGAGDSAADLLKRVDTALYTAKHKGRNRVCCAPEDIGLSS